MQISFCFCKTCICLKILENIQIPVDMIDRLDITDGLSVKCVFILNTVIFIDTALNISRKFWKCSVLWFYIFDQGVPNETKGMISLKSQWLTLLLWRSSVIFTCNYMKKYTCSFNSFEQQCITLSAGIAINRGTDQSTRIWRLICAFLEKRKSYFYIKNVHAASAYVCGHNIYTGHGMS